MAPRRLSSYWRWGSRARGGRPRISQELRENPTGALPKIHAELQKLGFTIAERSVARYLRRIIRRGDRSGSGLLF
jgi:hypothetical protein